MKRTSHKINDIILPIAFSVFSIFTVFFAFLLFAYKPYKPQLCKCAIFKVVKKNEKYEGILSSKCNLIKNNFSENYIFEFEKKSNYDETINLHISKIEKLDSNIFIYHVVFINFPSNKNLMPSSLDTLIGKMIIVDKSDKNLFQYLFR